MRKLIQVILIAIFFPLPIYAQEPNAVTENRKTITYPSRRQPDYAELLVSDVDNQNNLVLSNGTKVSLIGVAPARSIKRPGVSVTQKNSQYNQYLRQMLIGNMVDIELDSQQYDQFGHMLAYVYLQDGTFVNAEILRRGYAQPAITSPNTRYKDLMFRQYRESEQNKRGLWEYNRSDA